jgi:hypothetical protein
MPDDHGRGGGDAMLLMDLAIELNDSLKALPYREYRVRLHKMLVELMAFHRQALPSFTAQLGDGTIDVLAPDVTPTSADLAEIDRGWNLVYAEPDTSLQPWDYNARCLCWVLRHAETELTTSPYLMSIWMDSPLVGYQLRPATPSESV